MENGKANKNGKMLNSMGIPTRAVKAVILNDKGEMLILQRNPDLRDTDNWDLPGGLVEENENQEEALIREVKEELSIDIIILSVSGIWKFLRPKDKNWVSVQNYLCELQNGHIQLSDEHIHYRWVKRTDIRNFPMKDVSLYAALERVNN